MPEYVISIGIKTGVPLTREDSVKLGQAIVDKLNQSILIPDDPQGIGRYVEGNGYVSAPFWRHSIIEELVHD